MRLGPAPSGRPPGCGARGENGSRRGGPTRDAIGLDAESRSRPRREPSHATCLAPRRTRPLRSGPRQARADILFTQTFVADFEFSLPAGSPLNPGGPTTPFIPFEAVGSLTIGVDNALNDPGRPTSVAITSFSGSLEGVAPASFLPYSIDPNVKFVGGEPDEHRPRRLRQRDLGRRDGPVRLLGDARARHPSLQRYSARLQRGHHRAAVQAGRPHRRPGPFKVFLDLGNPGTDPLFANGGTGH